MSTSSTFFVALRDEIQALLAPLTAAAQNPSGVRILLHSLGHTDTLGSRAELRAEIERLAALADALTTLDEEELQSWAGFARVLDLSKETLTAVRGLDRVVSDPALSVQAADLGRDLVEHLLALHLRTRHPYAFRAASLLTLITPAELAAAQPLVSSGQAVVRFARRSDQLHPERIRALLNRPLPTLAEQYFPNGLAAAADAHAAAGRIFPVLSLLAHELGLSCFTDRIGAVPTPAAPEPAPADDSDVSLDHFSGREPGDEEEPVPVPPLEPPDVTRLYEASLPRFVVALPGQPASGPPAPATFAIAALASSAQHPGGVRGLIVALLGELNWSQTSDGWKLSLEADGQVPAFSLGPDGVSMAPADTPLRDATARLALERVVEEGAPAFVVGAAGGTRLEIGAVELAAQMQVAAGGSSAAVIGDARSGKLVLAPGDGDGFLSKVLPSEGLQIEFDFGLELSSTYGLRFTGGAGLEATLPVGVSLGDIVKIPSLHLGLRAKAEAVTAEVAITVGVSIGPVHALIERVGLAAVATFPEEGGNVGVADLAFGFKPPSGVGLLVEAPLVRGGGFVRFDAERHEYSGILELEIAETLGVKAMGLLTTRMPDGSAGYSLVLILFVEGFTPIQLGFGFALTGIGGLFALNRTFDEAALRSGLKQHTLDSVMFPVDPVRNAPHIISQLNQVFPPARGHHMVGPMLQIAWGTPALVTAEVGVVLEFGARLRLLLLAQVSAILPRKDHDVLRVQMDAVGVVDFDRGTAALDATLHDSRLLKKFVLTGDTAVRLQWKGSPNFALAAGGLHPAFVPPPDFPKLERIALNLASGDNPRIRCEAYFALTANTVQFGARAELYAAAAGFSIQGDTGFDVLIQLDPFAFLAEFHAQLLLKRGSTSLFKVKVEGALAGPRPLHLKARATFEIMWWDVTIRVDRTLVEGDPPPPPLPVDVLALLRAALDQPDNWTGRLPAGQRPLVSLRPPPGTAGDIVLHPLGTLTVTQAVVPLDVEISRFGTAVPGDVRRFTVRSAGAAHAPVTDFFAPAQFLELSDSEKLSRPSFEPMTAGVRIGAGQVAFSADLTECTEVPGLEFDTWIMDLPRTAPPRKGEVYTLHPALLGAQARFGAAGVSARRYQAARAGAGKYRVVREGWTLMATDALTVAPLPGVEAGRPVSYTEAAQARHAVQRDRPAAAQQVTILRRSDLALAG